MWCCPQLVTSSEKLTKWITRVNTLLDRCEKRGLSATPCASLHQKAKWLVFWGNKAQKEDPEYYRHKLESAEKMALRRSGRLIADYYRRKAESARVHHKLGSRRRIEELFRFVYYSDMYVIPFLTRAGDASGIDQTLQYLITTVAPEVPRPSNEFQLETIYRLLNRAKSLDQGVSSRLLDKFAYPSVKDSVLSAEARRMLESAKRSAARNDARSAIVQIDQALETHLKVLCILRGCSDDTHFPDSTKPFSKWGFAEYLRFLGDNDALAKQQRLDFLQFHQWRNDVQHHGIEPSMRIVDGVIAKVEEFLR